MRDLTTKVDRLEANDAQRQKEGTDTEEKPIILPEPQLMITAGPMGMVPPQQQYGYSVPPGAYQQHPYQGYGM